MVVGLGVGVVGLGFVVCVALCCRFLASHLDQVV